MLEADKKERHRSRLKAVESGDLGVVLPESVERFRDYAWRRDAERQVETVSDAERLIEENGFAHAFADARLPGASLYVAVCGRRDAHLPRQVRTDPECRETARLRDELIRRGRVFYGRTRRGRMLFIAKRLLPHFYKLYGVRTEDEAKVLSASAQKILAVLRAEWEMASTDLRREAKIADYAECARALGELQRLMKIVVSDFTAPRSTQIWTLTEARFGAELKREVDEEEALREIAQAFLNGAGMTLRGELARATGLSRPLAGQGNHALVRVGLAVRIERGVYRLAGDTSAELNGFERE